MSDSDYESIDLEGKALDPFHPFQTLTRDEVLKVLVSPKMDRFGNSINDSFKEQAFVRSIKGLQTYMKNGGFTFAEVLCRILELRDENISFQEIAQELGIRQADVRILNDHAVCAIAFFENRKYFKDRLRRATDE